MTIRLLPFACATICLALALVCSAGCRDGFTGALSSPLPLGTAVDELNRLQEDNAEAAKFIVYQHEFELNGLTNGHVASGFRLNEYGEDHVKQIAALLQHGAPWPVVVERSQTSVRPDTEYHYPVHFSPELDEVRRRVVVESLVRMGVAEADTRVVIAPSFAQSLRASEAEAADFRGMAGGGFGGFGGFGGGF